MSVYGQGEKWFCFKHGEFEADLPTDAWRVPSCPKCSAVFAADLCVDCEIHKATVNFSESTLAYVHGMTEKICRCCHFKRVEKSFNEIRTNYEKFKMELEGNPCA
jgi:hypothetical protein